MAENPVVEAIRRLGGPSQVSYLCRISVAAVYKWRDHGRVTNARCAVIVAEATGMSVKELVGLGVGNGGPDDVGTAGRRHAGQSEDHRGGPARHPPARRRDRVVRPQ